jgi:regulatory protein YycH of two-component signal transduction system YycFG
MSEYKAVVICGKTPEGKNVYTDGNNLYITNDEQYFYKYYGKFIAATSKKWFEGIWGCAE